MTALLLLERLKLCYPSARGNSGHTLFISALLVASGVLCDDTYSKASWSVVSQGVFTPRELSGMERELCHYLDWNLQAVAGELEEFNSRLQQGHSSIWERARRAIPQEGQSSLPLPQEQARTA
jgi:hypothetical protein